MTLQPPLPVLPVEMTTITERNPVFRLNGRFGAERYRIELSRSPKFMDCFTHDAGFRVSGMDEIAPTVEMSWDGKPLEDGTWYWRAFCAGKDGVWTEPANYRIFHVAAEDFDRIEVPGGLRHPYLILGTDELPDLRRKTESSERFRASWEYLLASAESILEYTAPGEDYAKGGRGQHGNYSTAASWHKANIERVAFAWHMTGDRKFAEKGKDWLLNAAGYDVWLGPLFPDPNHFDPPWHGTLETAMMTEGVAVGYDLLYDFLSESEREVVRDAIVEKGVKPLIHDWADPVTCSKIPRHQTPTGNWSMVCACSAGVGALSVLGKHPDAPGWVRAVRDRVRWWLNDRGGDWFVDDPWVRRPKPVIGPSEPNFGLDGGYKESHGYMAYAMMYVSYFSAALQRVTGENLFNHVPDTVFDPLAWSLHPNETPDGHTLMTVDFGDCGIQVAVYAEVAAALVHHRRHGRARWILDRVAPVPFSPRTLLWADESVPEEPPQAQSPVKHFRTIGRVAVRHGWAPGDPMLVIKYHQNRGHRDLGTYWLLGHEALIVDSGSGDYGGRIYQTYLAHSHAHNVLWVDKSDQVVTSGRIDIALGTPDWGFVSGELADAYPGSVNQWVRDAVFLYGEMVFVLDEILCKGHRQVELLLHPAESFTIDEKIAVESGDGESMVKTYILSPKRRKVSVEDGFRKTNPAKYLRVTPAERSEETLFATVHLLGLDPDGDEIRVIRLEGEGGVGGRIETESGDVYLFQRNGVTIEFEQWKTDAQTFVAAFHPWEALRGLIWRGGTHWTDDGVAAVSASRPVDLALQYFPAGICGSIRTERAANVETHVEQPVFTVSIAGEPIPISQAPGAVSFDVPAGTSEVVIQYRDRPDVRETTVRDRGDLPAAWFRDAPIESGARARASSAFGDPTAALDGHPERGWNSLPGLSFPQWLEVSLPERTHLSEIRLDLNVPAEFEIQTPVEADKEGWETLWRGKSSMTDNVIRVPIEGVETDRFRVLFHRVLVEANGVGIHWIRWR